MRILVAASAFLAALPVLAGDFKGNGGAVVYCEGQPPQVLDFFEARALGLPRPDLGTGGARTYLHRLSAISPRRALLYADLLARFEAEAVFLDGIPIDEIADVDLRVPIPATCKMVQAVNQNSRLLRPGKRYLVDRRVWDALPDLERVGLVFHELLYRESNSRTSLGIRILNSELASGAALRLRPKARAERLAAAGLPWAEAQGVAFQLSKPVVWDASEVLRQAHAVDGSGFDLGAAGQVLLRGDPVEFHPDGSVRTFRHHGQFPVRAAGKVFQAEVYAYDRIPVTLHPSGAPGMAGPVQSAPLSFSAVNRIESAWVSAWFRSILLEADGQLSGIGGAEGLVRYRSQEIPLLKESTVSLRGDGALKGFYYGTNQPVLIQGIPVELAYGSWVEFSEANRLWRVVAGKPGRLRNRKGEWVSFRGGQKLELGSNEELVSP